MRNTYIRHEDANGKQLPEGHMEVRKFGPGGFTITMQVPLYNEAAYKWLQDVQQIMHWMGDRPLGDIEKGLRLVSDMEAYFTTWRHGPKLVPETKVETK